MFNPLFLPRALATIAKPRTGPPPLPARIAVDVWEYLGDGVWGSMGQAFPEVNTDPFWLMLVRITHWWPHGHEQIHTEE